MKTYLPRIYDQVLRRKLDAKGAVLVEGAKWCGKTTTALQQAQSVLYLQDPATKDQNLLLADIAPSELLKGETPRLIDEWQLAPKLWDAVRFEVDCRDAFGQFILTGSSVPPDLGAIAHSGTGRISRVRMRPMSLQESQDSTGAVSLKALFDGEELAVEKVDAGLEDVAFVLCRGGWPRAVGLSEHVALQQAFDYTDAVVEADVSRVDDVSRNPHLVRLFMRSYARMVSSQGKLSEIRADMSASGTSISEKSLQNYLQALRRIFVIEDMLSWNPNLRSKTAIRTSETRHFVDPSIATSILGLGPADLIADLKTFGLLFESMCVRDLRIYADALDGEVFHYRDRSGLECDAVVHLRNGRYGLVEVKLGGEKLVEEGAASLLKLKSRIDTEAMREPAFLMVLTALGPYSYMRKDGVAVVPLTMLAS